MDFKKLILTGFVLLLPACTALDGQTRPIAEEDPRIVELKNGLSAANLRIDELNNKVMLLQEKAAFGSQGALSQPSLPSGGEMVSDAGEEDDDAPPEGLRVVKLKPSEESGKKKASVGSSGRSAEGLYNKGQDLFLAEEYDGAREFFAELVEKFPSSDLADNAMYWIGEAHYSERNYKAALSVFDDVLKKYPSGNKTPDAMLKAAYSLAELGETDKAAAKLSDLVRLYPDSPAADKARKRLKNS